MVSSVPSKIAIVVAFFGFGLLVASLVVVDWVYAVQGTATVSRQIIF